MIFDEKKFLTEELGTRDKVLGLFSAYGVDGPMPAAVEKWFQRSSIPSAWLPVVLVLLELENGRPLSLGKYVSVSGEE